MSRLFCDEHIEKQVAIHLGKMGHTVERVVDVSELGPSSSDDEIANYARSHDQLILTADDDFLVRESSERRGVLFVPTDQLDAFHIASIVDAASDHVSQEEIDTVLYVTRNWL